METRIWFAQIVLRVSVRESVFVTGNLAIAAQMCDIVNSCTLTGQFCLSFDPR